MAINRRTAWAVPGGWPVALLLFSSYEKHVYVEEKKPSEGTCWNLAPHHHSLDAALASGDPLEPLSWERHLGVSQGRARKGVSRTTWGKCFHAGLALAALLWAHSPPCQEANTRDALSHSLRAIKSQRSKEQGFTCLDMR